MEKRQDISIREQVGDMQVSIGGSEQRTIGIYYLSPDRPSSDKKRRVCASHIMDGAANELLNDYKLAGLVFPGESEAQEVNLKLSCRGVSCILKKCGLKIEQFNNDGERIGGMSTY